VALLFYSLMTPHFENKWRAFFSALDVSVATVSTEQGVFLYPKLFNNSQSSGTYWIDSHDITDKQAMQLCREDNEFVAVVHGDCAPPQINKKWSRDKKRKRAVAGFSYSGAVLKVFYPPASRFDPKNPTRYHDQFNEPASPIPVSVQPVAALQENEKGELDLWNLYIEPLNYADDAYAAATTVLLWPNNNTDIWGLMRSQYIGCGRKPNGPRLLAAYAAAQNVS
jgi:hypothetical protein